MNKELFAETENKVRRYYQKDKIINSLNSKINLLNKQIKSLEDDLKNCNINIDPGIKPLSYEERVQSSGDGSSYAEKETMRLTEYMMKRKSDKEMERQKILEQIDQIELDYIYMKDAIETIQGAYKELLKLYYEKGFNEQKVANILNWNQSQINRKKWKLMEKIADWDQWNKVS